MRSITSGTQGVLEPWRQSIIAEFRALGIDEQQARHNANIALRGISMADGGEMRYIPLIEYTRKFLK